MKTIIAIALSAALLGACNQSTSTLDSKPADILSETESGSANQDQVKEEPGIDYSGNNLAADLKNDATYKYVNIPAFKTPEMVVRIASINMRVSDYRKSRTALEKLVLSSGGYIANENEQKSDYSLNNTLVVRVSNNQFSRLAAELCGLGVEIHSRNMTAEDVGKTFVDMSSRLKTKKEVEARYIDLLRKAVSIKDILEIENNIRVIREEIEAKEGELKYLADQVSWSTINISMYQTLTDAPIGDPDQPGFFSLLGESLMKGWMGLQGFILGFLQAWPLWIFLAFGGWFLYKGIRRISIRVKQPVVRQTPSGQS